MYPKSLCSRPFCGRSVLLLWLLLIVSPLWAQPAEPESGLVEPAPTPGDELTIGVPIGAEPMPILAPLEIAPISVDPLLLPGATLAFSTPSAENEPAYQAIRPTLSVTGLDTVDLYTGILTLRTADVSIPGPRDLPLTMTRYYRPRSSNRYSPVAGASLHLGLDDGGWQLNMGQLLHTPDSAKNYHCKGTNTSPTVYDNLPRFITPDGYEKPFFFVSPGYFRSKDNWRASCVLVNNQPEWLIDAPSGLQFKLQVLYTGEANAIPPLVTGVKDTHNNQLLVSYKKITSGSYTRISIDQVTSASGRAISFHYSTNLGTSCWPRVDWIETDDGRRWTFTHETLTSPCATRLKTVVQPDAKQWSFAYNECNHCIDLVTNPLGGTLKVDFANINGFGRTYLLTTGGPSVTAGTWKLGYDANSNLFTSDSTTVVRPTGLGKTIYRFNNSNTAGVMWSHGTIASQDSCSDSVLSNTCATGGLLEKAVYGWEPRQPALSTIRFPPTGTIYDTKTSAQQLLWREISRYDGGVTSSYRIDYLDFDTNNYGQAKTVWETNLNTGSTERRCLKRNFWNSTSPRWIIGQVLNETWYTDYTATGCNTTRVSPATTTYDISRAFDAASGHLNSETRFGTTTNYTYHANGDVYSIRDPNANTTTFSNYYRGTPRTEQRPGKTGETLITTRGVNASGTLAWEKNPRGYITYYRYDGMNQLTGQGTPKTNPGGTALANPTYDIVIAYPGSQQTVRRGGTLECTSFGDGNSGCSKDGIWFERTTFDGFGRPVRTQQEGVYQRIDYDALGRVTFASLPSSSATVFYGDSTEYDLLGRLSKITRIDASYRQYTYLAGGKVRLRNERGFNTTTDYQIFSSPYAATATKITAPESIVITLSKDDLGVLRSATLDGITRSYTYNANYYLRTISDPERGVVTFGRDPNGNMTSRQVASSTGATVNRLGTVTYQYDGQNRLQYIDYPDDSNYTFDVDLEYDANGNLIKSENIVPPSTALTRWTYGYDAHDLLSSESLAILSGPSLAFSYTYNGLDARASMSYPSGTFVNAVPNDLGWPTQVSGYATSVGYWPNGTPKKITFANTQSWESTLNNRQMIKTLSGANGTALNLDYSYDARGNPFQILDAIDGNVHQSYDDADRLETASGPWGNDNATYYPRGELKTRAVTGGTITYGYDAQKRLTSTSAPLSATYTYDNHGNLSQDGQWRYGYNYAGQLRVAYAKSLGNTPPTNTGQWSYGYAYDGNGKRYAKTEISTNRSHYYAYGQNGQLLANQDTVSGLTEHVYLGSRPIAQRNPNGSKTYFFTDAQGSPRAAANQAGAILWRETYRPWGGRYRQQASLDDYPQAYTAQPQDPESGLLQLGARYYNPALGRFYAADPVHYVEGNIHSFSRYAYANNNPFTFVDPLGLRAEPPDDGSRDFSGYGGYEGAMAARGMGAHMQDSPGGSLLDGAWLISDAYFGLTDLYHDWENGNYWGLGLGLGSIAIGPLGKVAKRADDFVDGYRAVSKAEAEDIAKHGFRPNPNGRSMQDKWFSETREGAEKFKQNYSDLDEVVKARVPKDVYDQSYKHPNIDNTGPGFCVACDDLSRLRVAQ